MARGTRRVPKYSLYSTDSEEDQVGATSRGLDRCAALLRTIAGTDKHRKAPAKQAQVKSTRAAELGHKRVKPRFPGDKTEPSLRPGATSTPVLAHRSVSHAPHPTDTAPFTTVAVNKKTKRRRITAHRRLKSEPALDVKERVEGAKKKAQQLSHSHGALTPPPGPSAARVGHHSDPKHLGVRKTPSQPALPLQGDAFNRPIVPPTASLTPGPHPASVPSTSTARYPSVSGGPYPPPHSLPPWLFHPAYFPPGYPLLPPSHSAPMPPYSAPQQLPNHHHFYPHPTLPNSSWWNRSSEAPAQSSQASESAPPSSCHMLVTEESKTEEGEEGDLSQVEVSELVERLGKALVEMQVSLQSSGVSRHHLKPLRRSVQLFQALSLHTHEGKTRESPSHHNELLNRIQSLQNDNNSLQERLTQCELILKKAKAESGRLEGENIALQQQVATVKANLDKHRRECQNAVRDSEQLQSQLEMSQSEVRMTRMALAEKESEVTRAHDEALALRHCIASFLTEITGQRHTTEVGWKVPLSMMQRFQDLADDGNAQRFLAALGTEALPLESDETESTLLGDFSPSLTDQPPATDTHRNRDADDSPTSSSLTDLLENGLNHSNTSARLTDAKLHLVAGQRSGQGKEALNRSVKDASFVSGSTMRTTSSERQFRQELASLDAEIARLQLQFKVTANRTART